MSTPEPNNLHDYSVYVGMFKDRFFKLSDRYKDELEKWTQYHLKRGDTPEQAKGHAEGSIWGGKLFHGLEDEFELQEYKTEIIINLKDDTKKIEVELDVLLKEIKNNIIKAKREMPITQGLYGELTDYIRHANNKKVKNPFDTWNKIFYTYEAWLNNDKKIDKNLANILKSRDGKFNLEAAYNRVDEDLKQAKEFIRRAEVGTFPYNEKGEYKVNIKTIKL